MNKRTDRTLVPMPAGATVAVLLCGILLLVAVVAPALWGAQADAFDTASIGEDMSAEHWLGTDELGRDVGLRVLVATRTSLALAIAAALGGALGGALLGVGSLIAPRPLRGALTTAINVLMAFPVLLGAMLLVTMVGVGAGGAVAAIALGYVPLFARLVQTLAATVVGSDYVAAARMAGVGRVRLFHRHILLNIAEPVLINLALATSGALLALAGLSFLGLGVQPPDYDWGQLLNNGLARIYTDPVVALAPAVMLIIAGVAVNMLGEAVAQMAGRRPAPRRAAMVAAADGPASEVVVRDRPVISVRGLRVQYPSQSGTVHAVREVNLDVGEGERVGVVGESGSGKSQAALAMAGLIAAPSHVHADMLLVHGRPADDLSAAEHATLIGTEVAMVFQDPMTSFNPVRRLRTQLIEGAVRHLGISRRAATDRAAERFRQVRITRPEQRLRQYPHELSGGMRQRAMIAMGLMGRPRLIIADEPTTALDVTVQREVIELLADVNRSTGAAILLITHDIAVVAELCERVVVMYGGRIVEDLPVTELPHAQHPYTRALIAAVPDMAVDRTQALATIDGRPPQATSTEAGCSFASRCRFATEKCRQDRPGLKRMQPWNGDHIDVGRGGHRGGHLVACWNPLTVGGAASPDAAPDALESTIQPCGVPA